MNKSDVIVAMYAMLSDLSNGYSWRELHIDMEVLREQIEQCGIVLDSED